MQATEPLPKSREIVDEYGIMRHPPPIGFFKRKKQSVKVKGNDSSCDSRKSKSLSKSSSKREKKEGNKKGKTRINCSPYQPRQECSRRTLKADVSRKKHGTHLKKA